jgi:hypothetical protein
MSTVKHVRYSIETLGVPDNSPMHITVFGLSDENDAYKCAERLDKRLAAFLTDAPEGSASIRCWYDSQ